MSLHALIHDSELLRRRLAYVQQAHGPSDKSSLAMELLDTQGIFDQVLKDLDKPIFKPVYVHSEEPPSSAVYNKNLRQIWADLGLLTEEFQTITHLEEVLFTYASIGLDDLLSDISGIASMVTDLRFVNGLLRGDLLVGGDDFVDDKKRDTSEPPASTNAEISVGSLGLYREGSDTVDIAAISAQQIAAPRGQVCEPMGCTYEGRFFAPMGDQRPEGGAFDLQELGPEAVSGQSPQLEKNVLDLSQVTLYKLRPTDPRIKEEFRAAAYDGQPDTFWEYETNVQAYHDVAATGQIKEIPNRSVVGNRGPFKVGLIIEFDEETPINTLEFWPVQFDPNTPIAVEGIYYATNSTERFKLIPNWNAYNTDKIITRVANKYLSTQQKNALLATTKGGYKGKAIFPFPSVVANKIKVVLAVSRGYPIVYERLYSIFKNTVTVHVKKKRRFHRSKRRTYIYNLQVLLKLSYLQTLALYLKQAKPTDLLKGTPPTISILKDKSGFNLAGRILGGAMALGPLGLLGAGIGAALGGIFKKFGDFIGKLISKIPIVGKIFKGLFGVKTKVWSEETGWKAEKTWFQPQFDLARYAVGIREILVGRYLYAETSEYVSKPLYSPKEISKVLLIADDIIPSTFPPGRDYIKYYIQPDIPNYDQWHRINPQGRAPSFDDSGETVPKIINFNVKSPDANVFDNKYIFTEEPPKGIRVKIVISRPISDDPNIIGATPLVKSYRLLIYPKGGL